MFGIKRLKEKVETLEKGLSSLRWELQIKNRDKTVDCEICGCMVRVGKAREGESKIVWEFSTGEAHIEPVYYCKRCSKEIFVKGGAFNTTQKNNRKGV